MYIAICDDQEKELAALEGLLSAWQKERQHPVRVKIFRNAVDLLDAARRENFTLYLLDVLMPGMNGMVAAKEIRQFDAAAALVFLTATPTFAYESYSVHALEYLLKPISPKTLYPILDQLYLGEQRPQDGLTVKGGKVLFRIPFSQLAYVEVNHKHLYFNLTDGSVREVAGVLKQYEDQLLAREEFRSRPLPPRKCGRFPENSCPSPALSIPSCKRIILPCSSRTEETRKRV